MGWRDRDYARWSSEERRRFLSARHGGSTSGTRRGTTVTGGLAAAVAVSAALFALGHYPAGNPIVPALHFSLGGSSSVSPGSAPLIAARSPRPTVQLTGPKVVPVRSFLTFHGPVPAGDEGTVRILGSLNGGAWQTLATADGSSGNYLARIALNDPGTLQIRLVFRDGAQAAETITVR